MDRWTDWWTERQTDALTVAGGFVRVITTVIHSITETSVHYTALIITAFITSSTITLIYTQRDRKRESEGGGGGDLKKKASYQPST